MASSVFTPGKSVSLATTATNQRLLVDGSGTVMRVANGGASVAYVALGKSTVTAVVPTTSGGDLYATPVLPGEVAFFSCSVDDPYVAALCASGQTTTLFFSRGEGRGL